MRVLDNGRDLGDRTATTPTASSSPEPSSAPYVITLRARRYQRHSRRGGLLRCRHQVRVGLRGSHTVRYAWPSARSGSQAEPDSEREQPPRGPGSPRGPAPPSRRAASRSATAFGVPPSPTLQTRGSPAAGRARLRRTCDDRAVDRTDGRRPRHPLDLHAGEHRGGRRDGRRVSVLDQVPRGRPRLTDRPSSRSSIDRRQGGEVAAWSATTSSARTQPATWARGGP